MTMIDVPHRMTREQAAKYLGIRPQTLAVWACTHRVTIPFYKLGKKVVYMKDDLDAFLQSCRQGGQLA